MSTRRLALPPTSFDGVTSRDAADASVQVIGEPPNVIQRNTAASAEQQRA